jgi:hypothetical protein
MHGLKLALGEVSHDVREDQTHDFHVFSVVQDVGVEHENQNIEIFCVLQKWLMILSDFKLKSIK